MKPTIDSMNEKFGEDYRRGSTGIGRVILVADVLNKVFDFINVLGRLKLISWVSAVNAKELVYKKYAFLYQSILRK